MHVMQNLTVFLNNQQVFFCIHCLLQTIPSLGHPWHIPSKILPCLLIVLHVWMYVINEEEEILTLLFVFSAFM